MRSTRVLTKKPTRSSSALSVRPAIGLPIGMSVPAPSRVSRAASAACSTMNRLAWLSRASASRARCRSGASVQRNTVAAIAGDGGSWPVGRQIDLVGKILERLGPERELAGNGAVRVVLAAEKAVLPQRVVGILHRQGRQLRHRATRSAPHRRAPDRAPAGPSTSRRRRCDGAAATARARRGRAQTDGRVAEARRRDRSRAERRRREPRQDPLR